MKECIVFIWILFIAACSGKSNSITSCGSRPESSDLSPFEIQLLNQSVERSKNPCGMSGENCHFKVNQSGTTWEVWGQYAPYDKNHKICVQLMGGYWLDTYDSSGRFLDRAPGR